MVGGLDAAGARQRDLEHRPAVRFVPGGDVTPMRPNRAAGDGDSQTSSTPGGAARGISTAEAIEHPG